MLPPTIKHVHFIGIGGYGMSALALILLKKGYRVSGSDIKESALTHALIENGAVVTIGHLPENINNADMVVYSTAICEGNPELSASRSLGLPLWHRSELLAALLNEQYGIAVAGAHGKTTTTAMVALLLEAGGLDPTALIGGVLSSFNSNARLGQTPYLVAEVDESDGSFMRYYPKIALITNMEPDHLEHYGNDYNRLQQAYENFLSHLPADGTAVLCYDDPYLRELRARIGFSVITYSLDNDYNGQVDYYAKNITTSGSGSTFDLYYRHQICVKDVTLAVPGRHNISNAVGAMALAGCLGLDLPLCAGALQTFRGVGRRFEIVGEENGIVVIDDYAHHPTEVRVTIETARLTGRRICCIFQPHRYTRTSFFIEEFAHVFDGVDLVLLHSVYAAGETLIDGATSEALAERIRQIKKEPVIVCPDMAALEIQATDFARPGDMILVMGAGDITTAAYNIVKRLRERS